MKAKHNIYIHEEVEMKFEGKVMMPYTGEIYRVASKPANMTDDDWYIDCPCDLEELAGFNKVSNV